MESDKGKDLLIVFIVILVGLGSFELGRLSKDSTVEGLKIENTGPNDNTGGLINSAQINTNNRDLSINSSGKNFFASSKGSKYYSLGCSAGKTIKQENRVYFNTGDEAVQAGYTLSSSCN